MQSLNEGVELDNELIDANQEAGKELDQLLFANIVPGEVPELRQEIDVDALVTKLRALDYAQNNLETIGGINQTLALEAYDVAPGIITDAVPVQFYTTEVTKTRYSFALEAIAVERRSVIDKVIEAVKAFFVKLLEWVKTAYYAVRKAWLNSQILKDMRQQVGVYTHLERRGETLDRIAKRGTDALHFPPGTDTEEFRTWLDGLFKDLQSKKNTFMSSDEGVLLLDKDYQATKVAQYNNVAKKTVDELIENFDDLENLIRGAKGSEENIQKVLTQFITQLEKVGAAFGRGTNAHEFIAAITSDIASKKDMTPAQTDAYSFEKLIFYTLGYMGQVGFKDNLEIENAEIINRLAKLSTNITDALDELSAQSKDMPGVSANVNKIFSMTQDVSKMYFWALKMSLELEKASIRTIQFVASGSEQLARQYYKVLVDSGYYSKHRAGTITAVVIRNLGFVDASQA